MRRYIAYVFLFLLIAVPFVFVGILHRVVADQPTVNRAAEFMPVHIERAKHIIKKNDPRTMKPGVLRTLTLSQEEVDLAVNYLASRYARGSSRIELQLDKVILCSNTHCNYSARVKTTESRVIPLRKSVLQMVDLP